MLARSSPCHRSTARRTAAQKTRNCMLSCGVSPGPSRLLPNSSDSDQLLCLPDPLTPANGFSCSRARQAVLRRDLLQHLHRHHLVIDGEVGVLEDRRDFVLARGDLVVPRLDRHAHLEQLELRFGHAREHALGDGAEVLILHLLALRRLGAEERAAGVDQVGARKIEVAVDEEVLLLGTAGGVDALGRGAEQLQHANGLLRDGFHRAQQRRLLVERLTGPAHERRRNHERGAVAAVEEQPRRAGRIPRRVAARLEGGAHAAGGEARRVGLALDQLLAAELGDRRAIGRRREKRVVLLGGDSGHRLEPVRVVGRAVLDRPVLQRGRDGVSGRDVERLPSRDRRAQRAVRRLRQPLLLKLVVERKAAEDLGGFDGGWRMRLRWPATNHGCFLRLRQVLQIPCDDQSFLANECDL